MMYQAQEKKSARTLIMLLARQKKGRQLCKEKCLKRFEIRFRYHVHQSAHSRFNLAITSQLRARKRGSSGWK